MSLHKFSLLALIAVTTLFYACDDDDPFIPVEEEVITNLTLVLTPDGGGSTVTLTFSDPDGDGGSAPTITTAPLAANTIYTGAITLLNESVTPVEDITSEIAAEQEEHQFFYVISAGTNLMAEYADQDADGNPVGLTSTYTTGDSSTGEMTVILRHEPNKDATGVKEGDSTNAGGETDIEVTFPIEIQ